MAWYEGQAEGLGVRFAFEVDAVIAAIIFQPLQFFKAGRKGRKARVHGWPYSIYFVVNEAHAEIKVIAVWHGARNPASAWERWRPAGFDVATADSVSKRKRRGSRFG